MSQRPYTFKVTAPANTPQTNPVKVAMKLRAGVLAKIRVLIPSGHAALAHLAIVHGETQIMPWGDQQWIEGDNESMEWEPGYELTSDPTVLEARAWNEDDTFPHSFYLRVFVEPPERRPDWRVITEGAKAITRFVERVLGGPA